VVLTVNYALKKAIVEASFVLNKVPDKVNWIDNVEQNRVRKLLIMRFWLKPFLSLK